MISDPLYYGPTAERKLIVRIPIMNEGNDSGGILRMHVAFLVGVMAATHNDEEDMW